MTGPAELPPAERTLPAMLERQARRYGARTLLVAGVESWSFEDTRTIAARFAGTLAAAGIRPGDRVALMCGNRSEFMQVFLGCTWLGAIAVPINVAARGPQLSHILRNCGRAAAGDRGGSDRCISTTSILDGLALERIWRIGDAASAAFDRIPVADLPPPGEALTAGRVDPTDTCRDPLHLGHDRPVQGRLLPARAVLSGGASTAPATSSCARATCCARRCRCFTPTRSARSIRRC